MKKRHFILGTAGHIDHGKTALVKALTGIDTDRLKEEKARGLTIDLGFAHLGEEATIIDVPGHEKFIKNMVAGVSTIDLVLFVVAADDGVMPQTREHLDILNLLQVKSGIVVVTKKDLVEEEWLALVEDDIRQLVKATFLESAPIIKVSSVTGDNIPTLQKMILDFFASLPPRHDRGIFWLPVDRSFTMKGFGTVITGSVLSGALQVGEWVELLPKGQKVRVRGLQKHGKPAEHVSLGDRAAINLQSIGKEDIVRGDILASPGYFSSTRRLHGKLRLLPDSRVLKPNTRIRLHLGTAEILARVTPIGQETIDPGGEGYIQFKLEKPTAGRRLDPFVIRQYSPPRTIGGGIILDANPKPYRRKDEQLRARLKALEKEEPEELLREQLIGNPAGIMTEDQLATKTGMARETIKPFLRKMQNQGEILPVGKKSFVHQIKLENLIQRLIQIVQNFHQANPTKAGMRKAELGHHFKKTLSPLLLNFLIDWAKEINKIKEHEGFIALKDHQISLSPRQEQARNELLSLLLKQGFSPQAPEALAAQLGLTKEETNMLLEVLQVEKQIIRIEEGMYLHHQWIEEARQALIEHFRQHGEITVPQFKNLIRGASRKYAIPLLNYFDAQEITSRQGDVRFPGVKIDEN